MNTIGDIVKKLSDSGVFLFLENGKLKSRSYGGAITSEIGELIKNNKNALVGYLARKNIQTSVADMAPSSSLTAPLSYSQARLWFLYQIEEDKSQYNMISAYRIVGDINIPLIRKTFSMLIERHSILRTQYADTSKGPIQKILNSYEFDLSVNEVSYSDDLNGEEAFLQREAGKNFDLVNELPIRVAYYKKKGASDEGCLLINMHHISADGWSLDILMKEFAIIYRSLIEDKPGLINPTDLQYRDFALWQNSDAVSSLIQSQGHYWKDELQDLPPLHGLPLNDIRRSDRRKSASLVVNSCGEGSAEKVQGLARKWNVTPFMIFHAALALVLAKNSNRKTIVIGTPIANRCHERFESLVGFFVNTLVLKVDTDYGCLQDYIKHVKEKHFLAQENQDIPFDMLVDGLGVDRDLDYTPVFQIMLTTEDSYSTDNTQQSEGGYSLGDVELFPVTTPPSIARFDLEFDISIKNSEVVSQVIYDNSLFDETYVTRLLGQINRVIQDFLLEPVKLISTWDLVSNEDREFLEGVNRSAELDENVELDCLHNLFINSAMSQPNAVALTDTEGSLSYIELYQMAKSMSEQISSLDLAHEELIALRLPKGRWQLISTLAVLMSGSCYLPLEPSWPEKRCAKIIKKSKSRYLLVSHDDDKLACLKSINIQQGYFEIDKEKYSRPVRDTKTNLDALAYVIFTSGSTGEPKGVAIEHRAAANTILDINHKMGISSKDKVLAVSALSFDLSVYDLFGLLAAGGEVVFPDDEHAIDPMHWVSLMKKTGITLWNSVPASASLLYEQMRVEKAFVTDGGLSKIMMSGDWIDVNLPERLKAVFPNVELYSLGGATECAIWSIYYPIQVETGKMVSIPYGKPLARQAFFILNDEFERLPPGAIGELCIGGDGLAREYFQDLALSEKTFFFHPELKQRLYRTGDLGRYLPDGNIQFLGRSDQQLKINGFRIELGEIEKTISDISPVESCVVLPVEGVNQSKYLVAFVKLENPVTRGFSQEEFLDSLASHLPRYMQPKQLVTIDTWPLSSNGKLDRSALKIPDLDVVADEITPPTTEAEKLVAGVWSDLLAIPTEEISVFRNFFDLGGNSLLAIRMAVQIREAFSLPLDIRDVFSYPTISGLSAHLDRKSSLLKLKESILLSDSVEEFSI